MEGMSSAAMSRARRPPDPLAAMHIVRPAAGILLCHRDGTRRLHAQVHAHARLRSSSCQMIWAGGPPASGA